jgi:hypothetical protein
VFIECPVCKKENEEGDPVCLRCGSDLTALQAVLKAATWHLAMAAEQLKDLNYHEAYTNAERSWTLRRSGVAARLAFLAASASGDSLSADRWNDSARKMGDSPKT